MFVKHCSARLRKADAAGNSGSCKQLYKFNMDIAGNGFQLAPRLFCCGTALALFLFCYGTVLAFVLFPFPEADALGCKENNFKENQKSAFKNRGSTCLYIVWG